MPTLPLLNIRIGTRLSLFIILLSPSVCLHAAKQVAYIHGDVSAAGVIPSGSAAAYDPMLIDDTGSTGLSDFKAMIEAQGYTITQHYDQTVTLDSVFLNQFDVVLFGLHQKIWPQVEQDALDVWIQTGGGILMYSDSAAGGLYSSVGINNQTGQTAVNSILSNYGMEVAVDQGGGVRSYRASSGVSNPIVSDQLIFEGEGVSPVAIDPTGIAEVLIPLSSANLVVENKSLSINTVGITIANPDWAVMGHAQVGLGHVIAIFDRQPMWNDGPGSDIKKRDNEEILRRIVRYLAKDYGNSADWIDLQVLTSVPSDFQIAYRQWTGGSGSVGFDYVARNSTFKLEQLSDLVTNNWRTESALVTSLSSSPVGDGESERVTVRLIPDVGAENWSARVVVEPMTPVVVPTVDAGFDRSIATSGIAWLEATTTNTNTVSWSKTFGPGSVSFANTNATQTTATFSAAGTYVLEIEADSATATASDTVTVSVIDSSDVTIAINCGGLAYSGQNGFNYVADIHFDGGGVDDFFSTQVFGTNDDLVFNYARSKGTLTGYSIPVTNGNYQVTLQLAETYFSEDNKRVFDLSIEGQLKLDNIDLHQTVSGKWVAFERSFSTSVSDSILDIDVSASINNPLINAIIIQQLP
ncbi:MAG: malectin [Lentimonas sp.]